jgi:hypothetical protein
MRAFCTFLIIVGLLAGPAVCAQQEVSNDSGTGSIRGTLTFNGNIGEQPDTGARVLLVKEAVDLSDDAVAPFLLKPELLVVDMDKPKLADGNWPHSRYEAVAYSVADGNGHFDLTNIPAGHYTIVMKSSHVIGLSIPVIVTRNKKDKPLKKPYVSEQRRHCRFWG